MSLQFYRTLVAIAELGSFSQVAARLNMTLSAVSMQMKTLERDLDVEIFDRTVRPPRLTPLGREVAEKSRRIAAAEDNLLALTQGGGTLRGEYLIGFIATASVRLLPGFLARARRQARAARFVVETGLSERLQDRVAQGQLDAAVITRSGPDRSALSYIRLRREVLVYALPDDPGGESIEAGFETLPFLLFMPDSGIGRLVSGHLAARRRPKAVMILDSVEAIMECVNAGIGFTMLPRPDVERYAGPAVRIAAMDEPLAREIALVTAKESAAGQQAGALADLFADPTPVSA